MIHTISFPLQKFLDPEAMELNKSYTQNVTLFDDVDDDEFDGEFGEDDEEVPYIVTKFTLSQFQYSTGSPRGSPNRSPRAERKKKTVSSIL